MKLGRLVPSGGEILPRMNTLLAVAFTLLAADSNPDAGKKGTHCKVTDEAGAVVLEHDSEGTTIKCQGEIREKVKAEKCEPGKKLALQYVADGGKPIAMNISCPKK